MATCAHPGRASLHDIATAERFSISGPEVMLGPRAVVALGLVFHELGTNAARYGALSTPDGSVDVTWKLAAESGPA
jgi:two-component sensor histidine kinase